MAGRDLGRRDTYEQGDWGRTCRRVQGRLDDLKGTASESNRQSYRLFEGQLGRRQGPPSQRDMPDALCSALRWLLLPVTAISRALIFTETRKRSEAELMRSVRQDGDRSNSNRLK